MMVSPPTNFCAYVPMTEQLKGKKKIIAPASEKIATSSRRKLQFNVYWLVYVSWISCVSIPILLETQHRLGIQHFAPLPFLFLFPLMLFCAVIGFFCGVWRLVRGPQRKTAFVLSAAALMPFVFWTAVGFHASSCWLRREKPNTLFMNAARRSAASIMNAELSLCYPHHVERRRFTMFYQSVSTPDTDADQMDAYLTELEQRYHRSIRIPIYWVRGSLLGQSNLCDYGTALGSAESARPVVVKGKAFRETFTELGETDRHEVAHAVMHQWQTPQSDPPTFLEERWAESNGNLHMRLASAAADLVRLEREEQTPRRGTMLAFLLSADSYYHDAGAIYLCGAYITVYLIEKYGFDKFLTLYTSIHLSSARAEVERIYGTDLVTLEKQMWEEADRVCAAATPPQK